LMPTARFWVHWFPAARRRQTARQSRSCVNEWRPGATEAHRTQVILLATGFRPPFGAILSLTLPAQSVCGCDHHCYAGCRGAGDGWNHSSPRLRSPAPDGGSPLSCCTAFCRCHLWRFASLARAMPAVQGRHLLFLSGRPSPF
jgi:hypothetical protein